MMTGTGKQPVLVYYVRMLAYMLIALGLRLAALAPLACLVLFDGWQRILALLCPLLLVLVVLPMRRSFAQAAVQTPCHFSFDTAFSFSRYGEKLSRELLHLLHVIKWGIPMAGLLAGAYYCYTAVDALTIFQTINDLGNGCAALFGLSTANNFMLGIGVLGGVLGLGAAVWAWGVLRCSAERYLWALGADRKELRARLKGRRMQQLLVGLINLALLIPFLCISISAVKSALSDASTLLMMAITTGELPKLDLVSAALPVAGAFFALYLPLLPLRRWMTAAFAMRKPCAKAEKKVSA